MVATVVPPFLMTLLMVAPSQFTAERLVPEVTVPSPMVSTIKPFWLLVALCVSAYCTPLLAFRMLTSTVSAVFTTNLLSLSRTTAW